MLQSILVYKKGCVMKKKVFVLAMIFTFIFAVNVFSYSWIKDADSWYIVDEQSGDFVTNSLVDVGDNVYFLDKEGKMVTGWWRNDDTGKYYFFSNKKDKNYGGMLFGLHVIDGYTHYFNDDGSLATATTEGSYKQVYGEYYADSNGKLYYANVLQRDVSVNKSEYYTDPLYYTVDDLNNFFLANFDMGFHELIVVPVENKTNGNVIPPKRGTVSGGTNYTVDKNGVTTVSSENIPYSALEKGGPSTQKNK